MHPVWAHGKYNSGLVNSVQVIEFAICKKSVPFTEKNMAANVKTGIKETEHGHQQVKCMWTVDKLCHDSC